MLARSIATLATAFALAGCYRPAVEPPPVGAPAPGPPPDGADELVGWPAHLEFRMVEEEASPRLARSTLQTRLPVFESDPPSLAAAINARLARLARPQIELRRLEGTYTVECSVELANRYAVMFDCSHQVDGHASDADGQVGSHALPEPRRLVFGWWLRRGLPRLSLEQFAPSFDLAGAIGAAAPSQPAGCDLSSCGFDPGSFLIDSDGITIVATGECEAVCDGSFPSIPFDRLAPPHAWAMELVKRVRRRIEAGDALVEIDHSY